MEWVKWLREIPDFPQPGILFRDVLPVMARPEAWKEVLDELECRLRPLAPGAILAPEARGFLIAAPLADRLNVGLVPVRKAGKLPDPVISESYSLEYGENQLNVELDSDLATKRVIIVDDVLATGGTVEAVAKLASRLSAQVVGFAFLIELVALGGRSRLDSGVHITSLLPL
ncbi:MAG: adenine phosphoribosyltransferase [Firmicutes bacterium]|uniref:Adenine phosphoribosyltransferase n=1 Tax=Sulfobacillus benefaciens TaxID=453960 RepID=A0A2T2WX40_9FIRM|nr:adenine phosphoribosyltransferase [Bacillota bacterium]MCL5014027.1 adenine phosphoribosyltransferase [Bacillota bacterium]PSR26798.1 MAG: adenine phosphoribosyltransferase [Sulfobacillus benefaciens]HBQ95622.1 adenine phosphoribosyltransferase [Sulfobacillus sp.]